MEVGGYPVIAGVLAQVGDAGLRALLHHVAELAGESDDALTWNGHYLYVERHSAYRRPRESVCQPYLRLLLGLLVAVRRHSEKAANGLGVDVAHVLPRGRQELLGGLAGRLGDEPVEVAHPRLAGVLGDYPPQGAVVDGEVIGQPVVAQLPRHPVTLGDLQLLHQRVTGEVDDLHAVEERPRHGGERVGGGDEHDLRQVVGDLEVVIGEGVVLLGVEDLEQGRRRVAPEVGRHLVDLVQQEDGVDGAGGLHALDDAAREAADVGAAVAADLGLVAHPAQAHAHELPVEAAGDGLAEAGLADPRRTNQAEDGRLVVGRFHVLGELPDGEELQDALLGLLEGVMVLVEHRLAVEDVEVLLVHLAPGQVDEGVEVRADDGGLGRAARHLVQPVDLLEGPLLGVIGHVLGLDLAAEVVGLAFLAGTELLLDGLHLLAQVVLTLVRVHLLLDAGADLLLRVEAFEVAREEAEDQLEALDRHGLLERRLLVGDLPRGELRHDVGQRTGLLHGAEVLQVEGVEPHVLVLLGVLTEGHFDLLDEALDRLVLAVDAHLVHGAHPRAQGAALYVLLDAGAVAALHQDLQGVVGQADDLLDHREGPDLVQVVLARVVDAGIALDDEQDAVVTGLRLLQRPLGLRSPDVHVLQCARQHHLGAQRYDRQFPIHTAIQPPHEASSP